MQYLYSLRSDMTRSDSNLSPVYTAHMRFKWPGDNWLLTRWLDNKILDA